MKTMTAALRDVQQCPPNFVPLSLNGSPHQVLQSLTFCRKRFLDWSFHMATHKIAFGNGRNVYTTPSGSTFYYHMTYQERYIDFVIEARSVKLRGYYGMNGMYEFKSITQVEPYMNDLRCRRLKFEGTYPEIYGSIGKTGIGLDALRDAFDVICKYDGDTEVTEPSNFMKAFGVIDVHISESMKIQPVFDRICDAFTKPSVTKLGIEDNDFIERLITGWNYLSGQAMRAVDAKNDNRKYQISARGIMNISSVEDILKYLTVLHVDGFNLGIFAHDDAPNPRVWEPLQQGTDVVGVDDIPNLEDPTYDDEGGDTDCRREKSAGMNKMGEGGKRKLQVMNDKGWAEGEVEGRRRGVCLSVPDFPNHLNSGWGGDGTEVSVDQDSIQCAREHQDLECMPSDMSIMVESKYPLIQGIKSCSLTSLPFYMSNLQPGAIGMPNLQTEACKHIGTALPLGLEGDSDPLLDEMEIQEHS